ncbi:MAG: multiprotein-bridging factor 1 family protein [Myxococcota bacterium]
MGAKVSRLPRDPRVASGSAPPGAPDPEALPDLGSWLARERQLRGLSREWLAARLKLAPSLVAAIESGERPLSGDGHGRSIARALARSMGADPETAVTLLRRAPAPSRALRTHPRRVFTGVALGTALAAAAGVGVGLRALWSALGAAHEVAAPSPERVYRPDYVARLLEGAAPAIEPSRALRDTPPRP